MTKTQVNAIKILTDPIGRHSTSEWVDLLTQAAVGAKVGLLSYDGARVIDTDNIDFGCDIDAYRIVKRVDLEPPADKMSVHLLRSTGFRVEITHRRFYKHMCNGNVVMSEPLAEFEAELVFTPEEMTHGLQQKGGETTVRITTPYGKDWSTTVVCSKRDNFSRKIAVDIALDRFNKDDKFLVGIVDDMLKANGYMIAAWSETAASQYGYCTYKDVNGKLINTTAVFNTLSFYMTDYNWDDKQIIGFVEHGSCVSSNFTSRRNTYSGY